jgi:alpha-1,2-mannosyltransferase
MPTASVGMASRFLAHRIMESNEASQPTFSERQSQPNDWLRVAYILWLIFAIVVCTRIIIQAARHPQQHLDHTVYPVLVEGSKLWWSDRPLHGNIEELHDIYRYSPTFAILFTPLACLPEWLGACLWEMLSIGLFVAAMRVLARDLLPGRWTIDRQGVFLGLTLMGAISGIHSGQSNAVLVALVVFALQAVKHERWWRASFLLAFPVFIKLWPLAVVMLLAACWPRQLSWRFAIVAAAFALFPFVTKPPSVVVWQYQEWYASLTGPQQHRWPGFRDAWTIWEQVGYAFHWPPVSPAGYQVLQLATALAVLGWCLWQKRRLLPVAGAMPSQSVDLSGVGDLLTAILSIWASWQLLFGPGSEQITYGIIAPSAAWAVMVSFEKRKNRRETPGRRFALIFHRGWTLVTWLILGLFGMGDIENPLAKLNSAAIMLLPLGTVMFVSWLLIHYIKSSDFNNDP